MEKCANFGNRVFFAWVLRKFMSRAVSVLENNLLPFSPFLSRLSAQGMKNAFPDQQLHTRLPLGRSQLCWQHVFIGLACRLGRWYNYVNRRRPFDVLLLCPPSEGSANIAVLLQLVQRAGSVARTYSTINKSIVLMCVYGGGCYMSWSWLCQFQNRIISLSHRFFLISFLL